MSRLEPILNLSSTESEDSHDREPRPPPDPIFRQQKHLRRPIRPRRSNLLKGSAPPTCISDDDSSSVMEFKVAREGPRRKQTVRNGGLDEFQQHFIRLQQQSLQLLESAFEEIEDLKSQRRHLTLALHERDAQISSLSSAVESFQYAHSKDGHGESSSSNHIILRTAPMICHKKSQSLSSELSISDIIAIQKRHFFLNMVTTMEANTKSSLMAFIAQNARHRCKNRVMQFPQDPIVARLDSDGLEALRLPDRQPRRSYGRQTYSFARER